MPEIDGLKILSWNVQELRSKLNDSDFIQFVNEHEIIGIYETWIINYDYVIDKLKNFICYYVPGRKYTKQGRAGGGILVLVAKRIANFVKCIDKSGIAIYVNIDKYLCNMHNDLVLVFAYIPPEGSPFYNSAESKDGIDLLLGEITGIQCGRLGDVILMGDLNARTGVCKEFIENDTMRYVDEGFENNSFDLPRFSKDETVNKFGRSLISFCKILDVYIANGRRGTDEKVGDFTCLTQSGCSVVDYCILPYPLLNTIMGFDIVSRGDSDHLPIVMSLSLNRIRANVRPLDGTITQRCPQVKKIVWNEDKKEIFLNQLSSNDFNSSLNEAELLTDYNISESVNIFNEAMVNVADCMKVVKNIVVHKQPRWFDDECMTLKREKYRTLRRFRLSGDENDLQNFLQAKRLFKMNCDIKKKKQNDEMSNMLVNSLSDSKTFWGHIRFLAGRSFDHNNIDINTFHEHFRELLDVPMFDQAMDEDEEEIRILPHMEYEEIITPKEVELSICKLKNGKAGGLDEVTAEILKNASHKLVPYFVKLFNNILSSCIFPDPWRTSILVPLYKKGPVDNPKNYIGISLLSIPSKIFTGIVYQRLVACTHENNIIVEEQAGFRKGYSTIDNIFTLHTIVQWYLSKPRGRFYVAFVDFASAFDTINRTKLLLCLRRYGINNQLLGIIKDMYKDMYSVVRNNNVYSNELKSNIGVRQGCILSPLLFSIYINGLAEKMKASGVGVQLHPGILQICILLFADDIALFADTVKGLQTLLKILECFCEESGMTVNLQKTNIVVFRNGGYLKRSEKWIYKGENMKIVPEYKYLGVTIDSRLSYTTHRNVCYTSAKRILFSLWRSLNQLNNLSANVFFKIFDAKIVPLVMYGVEVWGKGVYIDELEKLQALACKLFLGVRLSGVNKMCLSECGRYPLSVVVAIKKIKYWLRVTNMNENRLPKQCMKMLELHANKGNVNCMTHVRNILCESGFGYVWYSKSVGNENMFFKKLKARLKDIAYQDWRAFLDTCSSANYYKDIKMSIEIEPYLDIVKNRKMRFELANFRIGSHGLEVDIGRRMKITRNERLCRVCNTNVIEDEFHFLLQCPEYNDVRQQLLPNNVYTFPNIFKFNALMSDSNRQNIISIAKFIYLAKKKRSELMDTA